MTRSDARLWLPFTQMRGFDPASRTFVRGRGATLEDSAGRNVFDAVSSIWTTIHGHCHPRIVEAIAAQAARLDHATTLGATNPVAESLAQRLCDLTAMGRAFFAGDGASAIETALKMTIQYWQNVGQPQRTRFVSLTGGYHGDTIGAMSVSDIDVFKARFGAVTFERLAYDSASGVVDSGDVAGVIVEPLLQAAVGMQLVPAAAYDALRTMAPLLIVDEIATGFGRTGTMFAFEQLDLHPDILCVGKGLTGGTLALSATLSSARVYDAFLGEHREMKQLFHGHSFAGNPIACAAALASLALFEEERTLDRAGRIARDIARRAESLRAHAAVGDVRFLGTMGGIELRPEVVRTGAAVSGAWRVTDGLYERGHFTRPIGNVVQLVPPLCSTGEQIDAFFDALEAELAT
ncbi:MAG TPA: adenosylmethionine--8-amino-7-oxononanoate transaminase [Candidatus Baltobacteraceae bacterium]